MEEKKKKKSGIYSAGNLSAFCLQVSLLLSSAVPLDEGLSVMAEDARTQEEKKLLQGLAERTPVFGFGTDRRVSFLCSENGKAGTSDRDPGSDDEGFVCVL